MERQTWLCLFVLVGGGVTRSVTSGLAGLRVQLTIVILSFLLLTVQTCGDDNEFIHEKERDKGEITKSVNSWELGKWGFRWEKWRRECWLVMYQRHSHPVSCLPSCLPIPAWQVLEQWQQFIIFPILTLCQHGAGALDIQKLFEYLNWNQSILSPAAFDRGLIVRAAITPFLREAKYKLWSGGGSGRQTEPNPLTAEDHEEFFNTFIPLPSWSVNTRTNVESVNLMWCYKNMYHCCRGPAQGRQIHTSRWSLCCSSFLSFLSSYRTRQTQLRELEWTISHLDSQHHVQ